MRSEMILRSRRFGSRPTRAVSPRTGNAASSRSNPESTLSTAASRVRLEASESENSLAAGQACRSALHARAAATIVTIAAAAGMRPRRASAFMRWEYRRPPPSRATTSRQASATSLIVPAASRAFSTAMTSASGSGVNSPERKSRICSAVRFLPSRMVNSALNSSGSAGPAAPRPPRPPRPPPPPPPAAAGGAAAPAAPARPRARRASFSSAVTTGSVAGDAALQRLQLVGRLHLVQQRGRRAGRSAARTPPSSSCPRRRSSTARSPSAPRPSRSRPDAGWRRALPCTPVVSAAASVASAM